MGPVAPVAPVARFGPTGPGSPLAPVAPVGPAGPCSPAGPARPCGPAGPVSPLGPCVPVAGTTDAGSLPCALRAISLLGAGLRAALMPFTVPAFFAKSADFTRPVAACPTPVLARVASSTAAIDSASGSLLFMGWVLSQPGGLKRSQ